MNFELTRLLWPQSLKTFALTFTSGLLWKILNANYSLIGILPSKALQMIPRRLNFVISNYLNFCSSLIWHNNKIKIHSLENKPDGLRVSLGVSFINKARVLVFAMWNSWAMTFSILLRPHLDLLVSIHN